MSYSPVEGFGYNYELDNEELIIKRVSEFKDEEKEVFRRQLTPTQARRGAEVLHDLPLSELEERYEDPNIMDGHHLIFEIRVGWRLPKTIYVSNYYQPDLAEVVQLIDNVGPEDEKIGFIHLYLDE